MIHRIFLSLVFLLAGCHISNDRPVSASATPADDTEAIALRDKIIVQRQAGTASESVCYRYALDAGKKGDHAIDIVLREYYASRGIDISGDPVKMAVQLHPNKEGSDIIHALVYNETIVYNIRVGSGMLSGGQYRFTIVLRNGLYIPISDEVTAIY